MLNINIRNIKTNSVQAYYNYSFYFSVNNNVHQVNCSERDWNESKKKGLQMIKNNDWKKKMKYKK